MLSKNYIAKLSKKNSNPEIILTLKQMNEILTKSTSGSALKYIEHVAYLVSLNSVVKDNEYYYLAVISSLIVLDLSENLPNSNDHISSIRKNLLYLHSFITKNTINRSINIKPNQTVTGVIQNILNTKKVLVKLINANGPSILYYKVIILTRILQMMSDTPFLLSLTAMKNLIEKNLSSTIFPNFTTNSAPYLPDYGCDKYTLVLDLDETLVHKHENLFLLRPGAKEFIQILKDHFELVIFTASSPMHADNALKIVDPDNHIKLRLYRDKISVSGENIYKDLSLLGRDLKKTIIVDNLAENFKAQPDNGICIETWVGDTMDTKLYDLSRMLINVAQSLMSVQDLVPLMQGL
ncbi:hypothetical protein SteCoe_23740 [Stentor coeruleus]|uniref:Mitochondrial import inner membrane translocase subunit TIM50 n=1 Tax=Stentor coeruleus TaxID=5963 RepID=A0A1R2BJA3_9CILI|nr:hypothetical protein SteCoe_23740 [Stentor coeruleus]